MVDSHFMPEPIREKNIKFLSKEQLIDWLGLVDKRIPAYQEKATRLRDELRHRLQKEDMQELFDSSSFEREMAGGRSPLAPYHSMKKEDSQDAQIRLLFAKSSDSSAKLDILFRRTDDLMDLLKLNAQANARNNKKKSK